MRTSKELLSHLFRLNSQVLRRPVSDTRRGPIFCKTTDGRRITFLEAAQVRKGLEQVLQTWIAESEAAEDKCGLAQAMARFYYCFIVVHPFQDGNGRTARNFLELAATARGFRLEDGEQLRGALFEGNVEEELKQLTLFFLRYLAETEKIKLTK